MASSPRSRALLMIASFAGLLLVPLGVLLLLDAPRSVVGARSAGGEPSASSPAAATAPLAELSRSVFGTISAADSGRPVAGAAVALEGSSRQVESDAGGRYRLTGLALGAATLVITAPGFHERRYRLPTAVAATALELDLVLFAAPPVAGTVIDPRGDPVAGAVIRCEAGVDEQPPAATSDAAGRFELEPAAAGCRAVARHDRFGSSPAARLRPGDSNVLQLTEPGSIAGVVVDERGYPIARYTVAVESFRPAAGGKLEAALGRRQDIRDEGGAFRLEPLPPGRYVLTAASSERPPASSSVIELADGEQYRGVRIALGAGATLYGTVLDADSGEPVAGARVALDTMTISEATGVAPVTTDDEGYYELSGVPPELFSIVVSAGGYLRRIVSGLSTRGAPTLAHDVSLTPQGDAGTAEYTGIGATLRPGVAGTTVGSVIASGPAERAGLAPGDVILRIDGRSAEDFTVAQCVQLLRGPVGSRVALTVRRDDAEVELLITRDHFVI